MLVLAHRGYHVDAPENTLDAFEQALGMGVDGIETDVRLTADGEAVLFHDRLAPDGREVSGLGRSELSDLVGYPVPTLDSALGRHGATLWNLEIKVPEALDATVAAVRRFPTTRFLVTSFWHPVVDRASRLLGVDCGLLMSHCPIHFREPRHWLPGGPNVNTLVWYYETADPGLIAEAAGLGLRSFVFGAVTRAEHARLAGLGVAGVITDRPEYLRP